MPRMMGAFRQALMKLVATHRIRPGSLMHLLVVSAMLAPLAFAAGTVTAQVGQGATMTVLTGQVAVIRANGSAIQPAPSGTEVFPGDEIRTLTNSGALITFFAGTEIELGNETILVVQSVSRPGERVDITLRQVAGTSLSRVQTIVDAGGGYRVDAGGAVALVRGSELGVLGPRDGIVVFINFESSVPIIVNNCAISPGVGIWFRVEQDGRGNWRPTSDCHEFRADLSGGPWNALEEGFTLAQQDEQGDTKKKPAGQVPGGQVEEIRSDLDKKKDDDDRPTTTTTTQPVTTTTQAGTTTTSASSGTTVTVSQGATVTTTSTTTAPQTVTIGQSATALSTVTATQTTTVPIGSTTLITATAPATNTATSTARQTETTTSTVGGSVTTTNTVPATITSTSTQPQTTTSTTTLLQVVTTTNTLPETVTSTTTVPATATTTTTVPETATTTNTVPQTNTLTTTAPDTVTTTDTLPATTSSTSTALATVTSTVTVPTTTITTSSTTTVFIATTTLTTRTSTITTFTTSFACGTGAVTASPPCG